MRAHQHNRDRGYMDLKALNKPQPLQTCNDYKLIQ